MGWHLNNPQDEQREQDDGGAGYGPFGAGSYSNPMLNYPGSMLEMTDNAGQLRKIEQNLRGVVLDDNNQIIVKGEPLVNEKGVQDIMMIMSSVSDRAHAMSHFESDEVKNIMEYLNDTLSTMLMVNGSRNPSACYGIKNPTARPQIVFVCNNVAHAMIKRGFESGERRFWKGSQIEYNVKSDQKRGGGWLSGLFKK